MSAIRYINDVVFPAAFQLLPKTLPGIDRQAARAMLLAIGLQESRFVYRVQISGPARGFWQFESGGVYGVLNHSSTKVAIREVLDAMGYPMDGQTSYGALSNNDILACVYARLLLWTFPRVLAGRDDPDEAWHQYTQTWRPGKPRRESWDENYAQGWKVASE